MWSRFPESMQHALSFHESSPTTKKLIWWPGAQRMVRFWRKLHNMICIQSARDREWGLGKILHGFHKKLQIHHTWNEIIDWIQIWFPYQCSPYLTARASKSSKSVKLLACKILFNWCSLSFCPMTYISPIDVELAKVRYWFTYPLSNIEVI